MTTPPIELAATVERIERKEPPPPSGWFNIYWRDGRWWAQGHELRATEREARAWAPHESYPRGLVRISPAPAPAETGAVPVEALTKAVQALRSVGARIENDPKGNKINCEAGAQPYYDAAGDIEHWLATQRVPR